MLDWIKNLLTEPDEVYETQYHLDPVEDDLKVNEMDYDLSLVYDIIHTRDGEWWKVAAVKKCREITGWGLKVSKDWVFKVIEEEEQE